jgi:phospholipid-translocating ATPase
MGDNINFNKGRATH